MRPTTCTGFALVSAALLLTAAPAVARTCQTITQTRPHTVCQTVHGSTRCRTFYYTTTRQVCVNNPDRLTIRRQFGEEKKGGFKR